MSKQKRPEMDRNVRRGGLDEELVRAINTQVKAAEESLRDYVDKRLGASETVTQRAASRARSSRSDAALDPPRAEQGGRPRWPAWAQTVAGTIAVLVVLGVTGYLIDTWRTDRERNAKLLETATRLTDMEDRVARLTTALAAMKPATTAVASHPSLIVATDLPGASWAVKFRGLSDKDPKRLGTFVKTLVGANETAAMTPEIAKKMKGIGKQLAAGTALGDKDRVLLRSVLLQCLAGQSAKENDPNVDIDGKFASVPSVLQQRVKDDLHVTSMPGDNEATADFESEAILRWAARKGL